MIKHNILFLFFTLSASLQGAALYKQNVATKAAHYVHIVTAQETKIRSEACARLNEIAQKSTNAVFKADVQKLLQLTTAAHPLSQMKHILRQYAFLAHMQGSTPLNVQYKQEYKELLLFAAAFTPTVSKNYTVNPQVELIQQNAAHYTTFVGNELQHTLHKEVVKTLDKAVEVAQLPKENALKQATIAAQCANTAHTLNLTGHVHQGFSWVSLGKTILHCSVAAIKGGTQAIVQPLSTIILHPLDSALRTWHTAQSVYKAVSHPQKTLTRLQEYAYHTYDFIAQGGLQRAGINFLEYVQNQPETAVEKATYYTVQFFIVPKILSPLKNALSLPNLAHVVSKKISTAKIPKGSWSMPEGRLKINGRVYTKHALERMAPNTPEVQAILQNRATKQVNLPQDQILHILKKNDSNKKIAIDFNKYLDPRGIPPMVIEDTIKTGVATQLHNTIEYIGKEIKVITNLNGDVITIFPKKQP